MGIMATGDSCHPAQACNIDAPAATAFCATTRASATVLPPGRYSSTLILNDIGKSAPLFSRMLRNTSTANAARASIVSPPNRSRLLLVSGERNWLIRYPVPASSSTASKPASRARLAASPNCSIIRSTSAVVSSLGISPVYLEAMADGATDWTPVNFERAYLPAWTSCSDALAPPDLMDLASLVSGFVNLSLSTRREKGAMYPAGKSTDVPSVVTSPHPPLARSA